MRITHHYQETAQSESSDVLLVCTDDETLRLKWPPGQAFFNLFFFYLSIVGIQPYID